MKNQKESIRGLSPESLEIANRIRSAMLDRENPEVKPSKLDDYLLFCEEALNLGADRLLKNDDIESLMKRLGMITKISGLFPANHTCVVGIVPVDRYGNLLEQSYIDNADFIVRLIVEPEPESGEAKTVEGYTGDKSYIHKVLPPEFAELCSFQIQNYKPVDDEFAEYDIGEDDRKIILSKFRTALENAQSLFNRKVRFMPSAKKD